MIATSMSKKNKDSFLLVQRQLPIIKVYAKTKQSRIRRELLTLSPETVEAISSIVLNIRHGNVVLKNPRHKTVLTKLSKQLELISNPALSIKRKRELLLQPQIQKGNFLPLLAAALPAIIGAAGTITSAAINRSKG